MKVSITFLKQKVSIEDTLQEIDKTDADYIHVDVMDGEFVPPVVMNPEDIEYLKNLSKPLDVHLMVNHPLEYIDLYKNLNTEFITIHVEINEDIKSLIDYIHASNIKAGIAINPDTTIASIMENLKYVDYVLIMGVNPGYGGQKLIDKTVIKITELKNLREQFGYSYQISFDGGVNKETRPLLEGLDIVAVGSFVTMSDDFQQSINEVR